MKKVYHECDLVTSIADEYNPTLPPNTSRFMRFRRWLIKKNTLSMENEKCKEYFRTRYEMNKEQQRHMKNFPLIIHPLSINNSIREVYFLIVASMCLFLLPFECTFLIKDFQDANITATPDIIFSIIVRALFVTTILLNFISGYCVSSTHEIILEPKAIAKHYASTYFIFDLIVAFPIAFFCIFSFLKVNKHLLIVCNYFIVFRLKSFYVMCKQVLLNTCHLSLTITCCIAMLITTFWYLHMFSCILYLIPNLIHHHSERFPETSWLIKAQIDPESVVKTTVVFKYLQCLTCVTCHFVGAGTGLYDMNHLPLEAVWSSLILIAGRLYTLYIIAQMLLIFGIVSVSESKYEDIRSQIIKYTITNKLPQVLKQRILLYFQHKFQKKYFNENKIMSELSQTLRQDIRLHNCQHLCQQSEWNKILTKNAVEEIILCMQQEVFLPNDVILKYKNKIDYVYFIQSGTCTFLSKTGKELTHVSDGQSVGIAGLLWSPTEEYSANCVALEITDTYKIHKDDLIEIFKKYPEFLRYYENKTKQYIKAHLGTSAEKIHLDESVDLLEALEAGKLLNKPKRRPRYLGKEVEDF